jgi:hypothetical protein
VSGELVTSPPLRDLLYGVEIDAVRLKRRVQMYQWIEDPNEGLVPPTNVETPYEGLKLLCNGLELLHEGLDTTQRFRTIIKG